MNNILVFNSLGENTEKTNQLDKAGFNIIYAQTEHQIEALLPHVDFTISFFKDLKKLSSSHEELFTLLKTKPIIAVEEELEYNLRDRIEAVRLGIDHVVDSTISISDILDFITTILIQNTQINISEYKVLIIDDSTTIATFYKEALEDKGLSVSIENNPFHALDSIESYKPHIIIMDENMPECQGHELVKALRQFKQYRNIPIIFLSGDRNSQEVANTVLKYGGDVFLSKPVKDDVLINIIDIFYKRYQLIENLVAKDSMTSLYNRKHIEDLMFRETMKSKRSQEPLSICIIDIDDFKNINEVYGHSFGDNILKSLAYLIQEALRTSDLIGRWGGEKFIVALPNTNAIGAKLVIDRLSERLIEISDTIAKAFGKEIQAKGPFKTTISCGISELHKDATYEKLIKNTEDALLLAKKKGKNQTVIFEYYK